MKKFIFILIVAMMFSFSTVSMAADCSYCIGLYGKNNMIEVANCRSQCEEDERQRREYQRINREYSRQRQSIDDSSRRSESTCFDNRGFIIPCN